ncbi:Gfo/Idh/MocA family oxidoreductase [Enterococcus faecium]|nr:Gfo/Idh/MocA family oxidoreductase [Enterococcus faecium]
MRIGIVGLGSMGKRRLRLIQSVSPNVSICGIDTNKTRCDEVSNDFNIETFSNLEQAKNLFEIDTVFICTSPITHEVIISQVLDLDCNIFTEINLLNNYYPEVQKKAKEKNKILYLSSTFLKRKDIKYIQDKLNNDNNFSYRYHVGQYLPDWHPWERYQDFFVARKETNGCREIFAIELPWIIKTFGKIKKMEVISKKISALDIDYPDSYNLLLEHENGVVGSLTVDIVSRTAKRELSIISESCQIEWHGNPDSLYVWNAEKESMEKIELYSEVTHNDAYSHTIIEDAYLEEIKEFFNVISVNAPSEYDFDQDSYTIDLINKIEGLNR